MKELDKKELIEINKKEGKDYFLKNENKNTFAEESKLAHKTVK